MGRKKNILVKDVLALMNDDAKVVIYFFAYGMDYTNSVKDGMYTVEDCKNNLGYDFYNATVSRIGGDDIIVISAELAH